jgi:hypothetical protein
MKNAIVFAILAVTIPLFAAEQKQKAAEPAAQPPADSPLVAAAKRAGRLNKKPSFVITNETLAQMNGGRLSVSTAQVNDVVMPAPPPPSTPEMAAAQAAAKERATRQTMAAEQKKLQDERTAKMRQRMMGAEDDGYLDEDAAAKEHALDVTTGTPSKTPEQTQQKPPQD